MKPLEIGQQLHCTLYGGKNGVIHAIHGEQRPGDTRSIQGNTGVTGGNAHFGVVWSDGTVSPFTPEALVWQSSQWEILDLPLMPQERIDAMLAFHEKCRAESAEKERLAQTVFKESLEKLAKEHPDLKVCDGTTSPSKIATANIRTLLKKAFPGVKFSVTSDRISIGVRWTDGPTDARVKEITSKFKPGYTDDDMFNYRDTPWNSLFGSAEYQSVERSFSNEHLEFCLGKLYEYFASDMAGIERKPVTEMMHDRSCRFPGVDISIESAVRALAAAWDPQTQTFDADTPIMGNRWLIVSINEQDQQNAFPTPGA